MFFLVLPVKQYFVGCEHVLNADHHILCAFMGPAREKTIFVKLDGGTNSTLVFETTFLWAFFFRGSVREGQYSWLNDFFTSLGWVGGLFFHREHTPNCFEQATTHARVDLKSAREVDCGPKRLLQVWGWVGGFSSAARLSPVNGSLGFGRSAREGNIRANDF